MINEMWYVSQILTFFLQVRKDILCQLGMRNPAWFLSSFNRGNLRQGSLFFVIKGETSL